MGRERTDELVDNNFLTFAKMVMFSLPVGSSSLG